MYGIFKTKKGARIRAVILTAALIIMCLICAGQNNGSIFSIASWDPASRTMGIISLVMALAAGFVCMLKKPSGTFLKVLGVIWIIVQPLLAVGLLQYYTLDPFRIYPSMIVVNYLFVLLFELFLVFAFGSIRIGCTIVPIVVMVIGITNFFVVSFRGSPIVPWDIYSVRTAVSVAGNYSYVLNWQFVISTTGLMMLTLVSMKLAVKIRHIAVRVVFALLSLGLLIAEGFFLQKDEVQEKLGMDTILFTPNVRYRNNGFLAAYIGDIHLITVNEPEEYSPEKARSIVDRVTGTRDDKKIGETTVTKVDAKDMPNIVVIMNEAFSDLSVLGDFKTSEDPMPFTRSLMNEHDGGHLMVSVKGGNTANTEYEFLTGDTMAFLPEGSVVYQQFLHDNLPALPSYLAGMGYDTIAIHPYNASGWERDKVYNLMGFREFLSLRDFVNPDTLRGYVSDKGAFGKIKDVLSESGADDQRDFIFEVTMQNHGGYSKSTDDFTPYIDLKGLGYENTQTKAVERYLSLIRESDKALEDLVKWLEDYDEPVIVVMFGDHQPSDYISNVIERLTGYDQEASVEEAQKRYIVPYVVWNNYGADFELPDLTSVNYLAADLLSQAGLPLTQYQTYLLVQQTELPVVCAGAYVDKNGNYYSFDEPSAYSQILNDYDILMYNHLIDSKNRVAGIFSESLDD